MRSRIAVPALLTFVLISQDLPAQIFARNINPLANERKAVSDAADKLREAKSQMLVLRQHVGLAFESRPDFNESRNSMLNAKSAYETARQKIIRTLENVPEYVAIKARRDDSQAIIDSWIGVGERKQSKVGIYRTIDENSIAERALNKMETEIENADPNCVALREKYAIALGAWEGMEAQVDAALKLEPAYPAAREAIDIAEIALKRARERYAAAARALQIQDGLIGPIAGPSNR